MINLKQQSGSSVGIMEFVSPTISHPVQTTGSITYTITHNFGIEGGVDLARAYWRYTDNDEWAELMNRAHPGYVYGQQMDLPTPADSPNTSKIGIARIAGGGEKVQFRCFKFTSNTHP